LHYYTFNIGDYRRDTSHLSLLEHGIYRQLIDTYYLSEQPLCADDATLMRTHCIRTADEKQALKNVLKDFFELLEDGWHHRGCEKVIEQYRVKSEKASTSAKARWAKDANALPTQSEGNANHKPITNNHKPVLNTNKRRQAALSCPEGVKEQVWKDFLSTRKAALTETALAIIVKEAGKAGWSLESALQECTVRGWRGFKADWVKEKTFGANKQEDLEARNRAVVERLLEKEAAHGNA
jgi:uncharacterized protein YdaU (DUF1376 family)